MRAKPIKGFENYLICCDGRVISFYKNRIKLLTPRVSNSGYLRITLTNNGKYKEYNVHRLVLSNFVENTMDKKCVNHKDSNRLNNNLYNLEWCTHAENTQHLFRTGRGLLDKRTKNRSKLVKEDIWEIRSLRKQCVSINDLASRYGVANSTIYHILNGTTWGFV